MIVYKDFLTGDELLTDIYPMKVIGQNKTILEVQGKRVTESSSVDDAAIGANPSAEEAAEGVDENSVSGVNVVLANRLQEVSEYSSKDYKKKIKEYVGRLLDEKKKEIESLEEENRTAEAEKMKEEQAYFKKNFQADLKEIILDPYKEKEFQFFVGETLGEVSMLVLMTYPADDPEGKPVLYYIRYGLKEMKV